jgi:quercetin dioxygenase-like cupin family protein
MPWEEVTPALARRLVTGEQSMFAMLRLEKGARVPTHSHSNEQMSYVLAGRLRFVVGSEEEEILVGPGQVLVLPSNVPHSAEALEDTLDVDIFTPPRKDWLDGTDEYLRR